MSNATIKPLTATQTLRAATNMATERIEELEALKPYIQHKQSCPVDSIHYAYKPVCNCGLKELMEKQE